MDGGEGRRRRWEARTEWPLTAAAVVFLVAYALPILRSDMGAGWRDCFRLLTWVTWAMFAIDYLMRLGLSRQRLRFVKSNLMDLLVIALPLFRPLRLLRLVTLLSVVSRSTGRSFRGRIAVYVAGATVLVLFVAALAILEAERNVPNATILSFGDAIWWAATTVTTVGYGDRYPVTAQGRFIAGGLMLAGIALLGIVTASVASWLLDRVREVETEASAATRKDVADLAAEIRQLREQLAKGQAGT